MSRYAMTYRAGGRRCIQHILAASIAAAYEQAFEIAGALPGDVRGFAVARG